MPRLRLVQVYETGSNRFHDGVIGILWIDRRGFQCYNPLDIPRTQGDRANALEVENRRVRDELRKMLIQREASAAAGAKLLLGWGIPADLVLLYQIPFYWCKPEFV